MNFPDRFPTLYGTPILLMLWIWLLPPSLQGQDPVFSQFWSNKIYLNPAYTGYEPGMNVYSSYRNQWIGIDGDRAKFESRAFGVSAQLPDHKVGLGLQYVQNDEGLGPLQWQKFEFDFAWRTRNCNKVVTSNGRPWELNLGAAMSHNIWNFGDGNNMVFSDQLDGRLGLIRSRSAYWQTNPQFEQNSFTDFSAGGLFIWAYEKGIYETGFAVHHLFSQRNQSIVAAQNYRPTRMSLHWQASIPSRHTGLTLYPVARVEAQPMTYRDRPVDSVGLRRWSWNYQAGIASDISANAYGVWVGAWWQGNIFYALPANSPPNNVNAVIVGFGVRGPFMVDNRGRAINYWTFGATYDYQYSKGGIFNDGGGIVEFQLGLHFGNAGLFGKTCIDCPTLIRGF